MDPEISNTSSITPLTSHNKTKLILALGVFVLLIGLAYFFISFNKDNTYTVRGSIVEVRDNSVVVKGAVKSNQANSREEDQTIEIFFTSNTDFMSKVLTIPKDRLQGPFVPKEEEVVGNKSDLKVNKIVYITASGSPFSKNLNANVIKYNLLKI